VTEKNRGDRDDRDERGRDGARSEHHKHNVNTPVRLHWRDSPVPGNRHHERGQSAGSTREPSGTTSPTGPTPVSTSSMPRTDFFVGRVGGNGPDRCRAAAAPPHDGPGDPKRRAGTPNRKLWAGERQTAPCKWPTSIPIHPLSEHHRDDQHRDAGVDSATAHYCGRADELVTIREITSF